MLKKNCCKSWYLKITLKVCNVIFSMCLLNLLCVIQDEVDIRRSCLSNMKLVKFYCLNIFYLFISTYTLQHSNKRKNRHPRNIKNDAFACKIYTHACRFANIFLLRHAQFFRTHARVWFQHGQVWFQHAVCDFHTPECDFHTHDTLTCDFYMRVQFSHVKCDLDTHECYIHTHKCDLDAHECDLHTQTWYCNAACCNFVILMNFYIRCHRVKKVF
jgi:hypothetical protein